MNGGEGGEIILVRKDVGSVVDAELALKVDGGSLDGEMIHAFVRGVEVVAALGFALAKDFADSVFDLGGGGERGAIGEADFAVGLSKAADGTELEPREAAEGGGAADEECDEKSDEQQRGDEEGAGGNDAPGFSEHC